MLFVIGGSTVTGIRVMNVGAVGVPLAVPNVSENGATLGGAYVKLTPGSYTTSAWLLSGFYGILWVKWVVGNGGLCAVPGVGTPSPGSAFVGSGGTAMTDMHVGVFARVNGVGGAAAISTCFVHVYIEV